MIQNLRDKNILLSEPTREELVDEILRLRDKVKELEEKLKEAEEKETASKSTVVKKKAKKRWRKLGSPVGHKGCTRRKPSYINHVVHQTLDICPYCGSESISELSTETIEHIQEDIIPVAVQATKFIRQGYWCPSCKNKISAPYAPGEIPYGYLGPHILIQTILMKYHYGLSYDKMVGMFREFHGLNVSKSGLAQALQRISRWLSVEDNVILQAIRCSQYVHMDETGWKIAGRNHWIWNVVNERLALYRIRLSRGRKVPEEILTKEYQGIVISDFLSAYDKSGDKRQRCLVHLTRTMEKSRELDQSEESQKAFKRLKRIINDAYRLNAQRNKLSPIVFFRRFHRIKERLFDFGCSSFSSRHWQRLSKRLLKYYTELLTFLEIPGLPSHNNHAERMIRPNVIFRKVSFQNMSWKGANAHEILMSILQTLRLQKIDPLTFFKSAYLLHRQGNHTPLLVPP